LSDFYPQGSTFEKWPKKVEDDPRPLATTLLNWSNIDLALYISILHGIGGTWAYLLLLLGLFYERRTDYIQRFCGNVDLFKPVIILFKLLLDFSRIYVFIIYQEYIVDRLCIAHRKLKRV
jgi:hypothetical protein